jgi:hypothetical protein
LPSYLYQKIEKNYTYGYHLKHVKTYNPNIWELMQTSYAICCAFKKDPIGMKAKRGISLDYPTIWVAC